MARHSIWAAVTTSTRDKAASGAPRDWRRPRYDDSGEVRERQRWVDRIVREIMRSDLRSRPAEFLEAVATLGVRLEPREDLSVDAYAIADGVVRTKLLTYLAKWMRQPGNEARAHAILTFNSIEPRGHA